MMSTSTLLFLITCGQFLLSVQGLTLRLKGKDIIPDGGNVSITDLPVGGCRRYDTLECLSDVPYRGRVEEAYWVYTALDTCEDHVVDDIRCKDDDDHECWKFGWQSTLGIYKKDKKYYSVVRLGRQNETAASGVFTCHFKGERDTPVSVAIGLGCSLLSIPNVTDVTPNPATNDYISTISWDAPCGGVEFYTLYYDDGSGACQHKMLGADIKSYMVENLYEMQIGTHRNNTTKCSPVYNLKKNKNNGCGGYCTDVGDFSEDCTLNTAQI